MIFKRVIFSVIVVILGLMFMGGCPPEPDDHDPVITLNGNSSITIKQDTAYVEAGATATDKEDGDVKVTINGSVDSSKVGTYTITYIAIDSDGNKVRNLQTINLPILLVFLFLFEFSQSSHRITMLLMRQSN